MNKFIVATLATAALAAKSTVVEQSLAQLVSDPPSGTTWTFEINNNQFSNQQTVGISTVSGGPVQNSGDIVEIQFLKYPWLFFDRNLPDDDEYMEDFIDWRLENDPNTNTCAVQFSLEMLQNIKPLGRISLFRLLKWFSYETGLFLPDENDEP